LQYIGDAKSGRFVGADQCVEFHSGDADLFWMPELPRLVPRAQFQRNLRPWLLDVINSVGHHAEKNEKIPSGNAESSVRTTDETLEPALGSGLVDWVSP